jgi:chromosome segregation protein
MFLRSLNLRGFKSFADKTKLEFTPGISVIVGPNGSGKSNIADAIAWVLGEQGPRALRGGQMTDVIFAGSPARPPLGMAEVRMVIDNAAGLIPVPASEIEISRLVYRSGESEYRLGGRPCRLLDIQELLSDTGVGRSLHTIIGQGQLDEILTARPEERRQFVEEAAGIAKYRRRRERAERRLAGMEQDLLRLQDLVGELRRQLKPLKQQAELSQRHETLTNEAAELVRKLAGARLRELYREREARRPGWQEAESRQAEAQARLAGFDAQISQLEAERDRAEEEQREAEAGQGRALEGKSRAEGSLRAAIRAEADAREHMAAAANSSGRLFALQDELGRTEAALSDVLAALRQRETQLEEAERTFTAGEIARRDAEEERRQVGELRATRKAESDALHRTLLAHEAERGRLDSTLAELKMRVASAETRATRLEEEIERLDALETPLAAEQGSLTGERADLSQQLADLEAEEKGLLARQEVVEARRAEVAESAGASFLRRRRGRPIGLLRELIEAPPDLWPALRAALGLYFDAVVYATRGEAMADATAEPGDGVTLAVEEGSDEATPSLDAERSLLRAVRPDRRVRRLAGGLLGEVYLAKSLADAEAKNRAHPLARFVTPDGAMVGASFVRTAAGRDGRLEEVRRLSAAVERELASVRRGLREGRQRLAALTSRGEDVARRLDEADRTITSAADDMARTQAETAMLSREAEIVSERLWAVEAAAAAARQRLHDVPDDGAELPSLAPAPEPPVSLRVEVEALRRERSRLEAGVDATRQQVQAMAAEDPIALRQALQTAEGERRGAEEEITRAEDEARRAQSVYREATERARAVQGAHAEAVRAWREEAAQAERLRSAHEEEDRARYDLERRVADGERVLREGHGADPGGAVAELGEEDTVEELLRRSELVARRLGLLGRVNLLASGELDSVQERHDFLVRELEDVNSARRDLERLIEDIDRRVGEEFEAAFVDVAREFSNLFVTMFPGGEGRLTLTEPDNPLATGIEVEARPSRGRVKRLSLLSGGERSLAALAFLFAIFRARPSPFYLMDEVEAALDDINLHRFLEVVNQLARDSQILIVTHQKRTMEVADALYGVTMGHEGASTVISQRLAEVSVD